MKMQMRKMCILKSFYSLLEASERENSFDYLIGCGKVCCNHNTSSRNRATIEWDGIFSYLRNFEKKKFLGHSFQVLFLPEQ